MQILARASKSETLLNSYIYTYVNALKAGAGAAAAAATEQGQLDPVYSLVRK